MPFIINFRFLLLVGADPCVCPDETWQASDEHVGSALRKIPIFIGKPYKIICAYC